MWLLIIGLLAFLVVTKAEATENRPPNYGETVWNFIILPFGMSGPEITDTFSKKVFVYSWVIAWFLLLAGFSSDLSSSMTVHKFGDSLNSFKEISDGNRPFFWSDTVRNLSHPDIRELKKKYEKFRREFADFENETRITEKKSIWDDIMAKSKGNIYFLCSMLDLKLFNISSDSLELKKDWTVPFTFHFKFRNDYPKFAYEK